ncbi:hypothetical protein BGW36DRAFT_425660 [Talaromyces proteolyticus]|uniref:Uncharacterized protein n=1 Tax=Talaromyces proteolyticus TaxID=1131652 RepID=A0AAD4KZB7_9EURO|nr:uncharacterized protein BGW36DRAFT_425660 [Talaromyces proteolyticus]KAH8700856.1 hypothetical protein BGW36DRAFT_425660 [Talaromyces proteolyticus]
MTPANSKRKRGMNQAIDEARIHKVLENQRGYIGDHESLAHYGAHPSPSNSIKSQDLDIIRSSPPFFESQEVLATQFPPQGLKRRSSTDSVRSQEGDVAKPSLAPSESQEIMATQLPPQKSPSYIARPPITDAFNNRKSLLQHLKNPNIQRNEQISRYPAPVTVTKRGLAIEALLNPRVDTKLSGGYLPAENSAETPVLEVKDSTSSSQPQVSPRRSPLLPLPSKLNSPHSPRNRGVIQSRERSKSQSDIINRPRRIEDQPTPTEVPAESYHTKSIEVTRQPHIPGSDPWNGMTKIRRKDVKIPKDQEDLFNGSECWIPANVGHPTPHGHVPPALLQEWNRRMSCKNVVNPSPERLETPSAQVLDDLPPLSQSGLQLEDESGSEVERAASWSVSPPRHIGAANHPEILPPDSSPVGQKRFRVTKSTPTQKKRPKTNISNHTNNHDVEKSSSPASPEISQNDVIQEPIIADDGQDVVVDSSIYPSLGENPISVELERPVITDTDDESDMEVSIPYALGASVQEDIASQVEQSQTVDPDSSNPSCAPPDRVQILNTQSSSINRAKQRSNKAGATPLSLVAPSSSSDVKSPSQTTANSVGSQEKNSSLLYEENLALTRGTIVADSQNSSGDTHQSSHSSHQDGQRVLDIVPDSSIPSIRLQTQEDFHYDETHNEDIQNSFLDSVAVTPSITLKRSAENLGFCGESPSKRFKNDHNKLNIAPVKQITVVAETKHVFKDKHRDTFDTTPDGPLRVFEMFKKTYPIYNGDFGHFKSLCNKLQSLRGTELLRHYFCWDDFILKHIIDYGNYVQTCVAAGKNWEDYEVYFCANFTKPSFKKRSLVPHTLDAVVLEPRTISIKTPVVDIETEASCGRPKKPPQVSQASAMVDIGIQASLVDQDMTPATSDTTFTVRKSTRIVFESPPDRPETTDDMYTVNRGTQINLEIPMPLEHESMVIDETQQSLQAESDGSEGEIDDEMDAERHETASQELGNEPEDDVGHSYISKAELVANIQREDREAVQDLFNTLLPQPPADPFIREVDTPFRSWARADQNVVSERRRRGGWPVPCDKDGNILVTHYPRVGGRGNRRSIRKKSRSAVNY